MKKHILVKKFILIYFVSPWRIMEDCGSAFAMGFLGGGIWHGVKGARNAPTVI